MKSFRNYIKEQVLPSVQVADGGLDIDKPAVRAAINAAIAGVVSQPAVTPYVVYNRLSKLLAQYHIILPKRFLEGDKGVEVFELRQFGHKMGMTDSGEFVNEVPSTHYLFVQYGIITPFGITYAKPVVGGMFKVMARIVDKDELDKLMDMAEITMAEEAEVNQAIAKANAPREPMHDITSDEKKKGNKEAVEASEKKSLDEAKMTMTQKRNAIMRFMSHNPEAGKSILKTGEKDRAEKKAFASGKAEIKRMKKQNMEEDKDPCWKGYEMIGMKKKGGNPVPNCVPVKEEEQIDEVSKRLLGRYIKKAHVSGLGAAAEGEQAYSSKNKEALHRSNKTGEKREQGIERAVNKMTGSARVPANEAYEKQEAGVKTKDGKTHTLHRRNPGHPTEYHTITTKDTEGRTTVKAGKPKYIKKHWDKLEETQIDELNREQGSILNRYIGKTTDNPKREKGRNLALKKKWGDKEFGFSEPKVKAVDRHVREETDAADETNMAKSQLKAIGAKSSNLVSMMKNPKNLPAWVQSKLSVAKDGITSVDDYMTHSDKKLNEKAPSGAKFERMVKHIKKGYSKDGLTAKEKGIAYATAWKAKKKEKSEE